MKFLETLRGEQVDNEQDFFSQKASIVNSFNARMFNDFVVFTFSIFLILAIASLIPFFKTLHPLFHTPTRVFFIVCTIFYGLGVITSFSVQGVIQRHPIPFLYTLYLSLYIVSLFLNLTNAEPIPYILLIGFRMTFPVLVLDRKWRINLCNNLVMTFAMVLSFMYKPVDIFVVDMLISIVFTATGMVVTGLSLNNQIRYILVREQRIDEQLELEKSKSRAKTSFLANMSHEIRTPINSILGLDEMIIRESTDPKISEYASNIKLSGNTLLKIINDILDFSKIEAGKMEILSSEYELSSLIMDLVNMTTQMAHVKHLAFNVNVDENIPHLLYGDELRVKQCVLNILNNAVKYTQQGSVSLDIGFSKLDSQRISMHVTVSDTGIGIKQEDLPKLFSAFERIEESRNRTIEGSGLGLSLVQMLLKNMGSHLDVKSEYGKGSVFSFDIEQRVVWWEKLGNFNERYQSFLQKLSIYQESFHAPNARILVVDDTKMNLLVVEGLLKQTHIQIDTALSGPEMLQKVQKTHYDMIFIDYRMPGMDGVEAFHEMEGLETNLSKGVPCIALTANVTSGAREFFLQEGFADYLSKPVDTVQLEQMLRRYLPQDLLVFVPRENKSAAVSSAALETVSSLQKSIDDRSKNADTQTNGSYRAASSLQEETEDESEVQPVAVLPAELEALSGIDAEIGLTNCGSVEILMTAIQEYYDTIEARAKDIETYVQLKDWKNYTVQVHALKSASRLIGAVLLGEKAAALEKTGDVATDGANTQDGTDAEERIQNDTPALLELYRSYLEKLAPVVKKQDGEQKEVISRERLLEAISAIKEYACSYDFNAIDSIIEMIEPFAVPKECEQWYNEIKHCVRAGDSEALQDLLKKLEA